MRKLSEQEVEVLQQMIVNEGWMPIREYFGVGSYSATYMVDDIKYIICKECEGIEVWEIE